MSFSLSDPVVQSYLACATICAVKLLAVAPMTITMRMIRGVFQNPEDSKLFGGSVNYEDSVVERIRRAHLNDLENIPAFWFLGALYLTTGPVTWWAKLLFRTFTVARIIHTIVYAIIPLPQPTRGAVFVVGALINFYMGVQILIYYITFV